LDISNFYNQIYHHTIENQLISSNLPNQAVKWCLRLLETVSAKVSRGIPVGPHAAHLLVEASLIPVDNSLVARAFRFCRFVDDLVIFADDEMTARMYLYQIAEILDKQQRLQLQRTKTKILSKGDFQKHCHEMIEDRPVNDLELQLLTIIDKYSKGNPYRAVYLSELSDEDFRTFQPSVVEKILSDYFASKTLTLCAFDGF
jgi:retron-type reverse transcriptase